MAADTINMEKGHDLFVENVEQAGRLANIEDHKLTPIAAIKKHPWTIVWCIYAIWVLVSASFENQAGGSVLAIPEFRKDFGYLYEGSYVLYADWQSAFSGAPVASSVIGGLLAGSVADTIGRRGGLAVSMLISIVGITLEFIATTNPVFFAGKFVNGFAIGGFIAISLTYIGEIVPVALRGIISSASAIAFTFGPFIASLIINATGDANTRWAYRAVFMAQYGTLALSILGLPFMPESPWWLLSKGKEEKAAKSLKKLGYSVDEVERNMATIILTLEEARRETDGATYVECFRKSNLRRTMISVAPLTIQALSGIYFVAAYSTYYYELSGFSTSTSFKLQIIATIVSLLGNVVAWFLIDRVGRRSLIFYGLMSVTVILFVTGALATVGTAGALKGTCALIMVYSFVYNATIGASAYTILTETATARLRVKTIALGSALQNATYTMWAFVLPYLFNPNEANMGAKVTFIFGGLAVICLVYLWFCQPETAGRTYEELDELFMNNVSARKFEGIRTEVEMKAAQAQEIADEISS